MTRLTRGFGIVAKSVIRDAAISTTARLVYVELCTYADDDGYCFPSNETLAEDVGISLPTVKRCLAELADTGIIRRDDRYVEGRQTTSVTQLLDAKVSHRGITSDPLGGIASEPPGGFTSEPQNKTSRNRTTMNRPQRGEVVDEPLLTLVDVSSPDGDGERRADPTTAAVDEAFDEWWALYPRKVKKIAARKAFGAACRKVGPRLLIEAIRRQAPVYGKVDRYVPHPATWLNDGSWDDDIAAIRPDTRSREQKLYDEGYR